ncbi:MAG TPA: hypothetical protein VGF16_00085 [Bryobacteraceae bacterium]
MPTVLILVQDLGFQFWLGQGLSGAGFSVIPAKTPSQARRVIAKHEMTIDLAVVDPRLSGVGPFVEGLRERQGYLRVLSMPVETATVRSTMAQPEPSREEWVNRIRRTLTATANS